MFLIKKLLGLYHCVQIITSRACADGPSDQVCTYVYADLGALTTPKPANLLELAVNWQPFLMKVITKFDCSDFRTGCMECQIPRKSVNIAKQLYYVYRQ